MSGKSDMIHMGEASSALRVMRENQRQNAHIHLAHDYGYDAVKYIQAHYNFHDIQKAILTQRAEMTIADTLYDAEGKLVGKIDLAKLGISPQDIEHVESLKAAEAERVVGQHTAAAISQTAANGAGTGRGGPA